LSWSHLDDLPLPPPVIPRPRRMHALAGMSADYYNRIEQQRGSMPSEQMLSALATALRLSPSERDHLFSLGGQPAPSRIRDDVISPIMARIVHSLSDIPAMVWTNLGQVLVQTPPAVALVGDYTQYTGLSRYLVYRFFTDPAQRELYPPEDRDKRGRVFTADLRVEYRKDPHGVPGEIVEALLAASDEFAEVWGRHEVDVTHHHDLKRYPRHRSPTTATGSPTPTTASAWRRCRCPPDAARRRCPCASPAPAARPPTSRRSTPNPCTCTCCATTCPAISICTPTWPTERGRPR
ncbi:helix-turn-helix transcriptional regulator, partial [Actinoplanes philippinensis]|uniref:helix-turn-helix transcriptional regulator n=1 Tax=Actinoplanes philippinensis TaxID=35752 RepID=UPI0033FC0240